MFDRRIVLVPFSLFLGTVLAAQDTDLVRMQRRTDSLADEWRRANILAGIADSLEHERAIGGRDTIAVGALRIIANPSRLPLRPAAVRVWPAIDSFYGSLTESLIHRPYLILATDPDTTAPRRALRVGLEIPWDLDADQLTRLLIANVPIAPPDHALGDWLGSPLRPPQNTRADFGRLYVRLVTAPSSAARRCFVGDIPSCGVVLDLDDSAESFMRWYERPEERRAVLRGFFADYFNRPATVGTWRDCMHGDDTKCIQLLRTLPRAAVPRPLDFQAHRLLAYLAIRSGGREAYPRLLADSGVSLSRRLEAAAGMPLDSLLRRWHGEVIAARPTPVTLPLWGPPAVIGWIVLLAGCALTSSRWRVR